LADFSLAQIGEASGGASPQPAVQQPNPVTAAVQFASGVGSSLFSAMQDTAEAEKETAANKAVTRFSKQQMQIAELVDQGRMSSQEGRMRMRRNLIKAGGDNPNLSQAFSDAHKAVIGTAGMGKVAAEGTEQEQAFFAAQEAATKDGFVLPDMTQVEAEHATIQWQKFQKYQSDLELESKEQSLRNARQSFQTGQITQQTARITQESALLTLEQKKTEKRSWDALTGMADGASFRFKNIAADLQQKVENNQMSREEATQRLDEEWQILSSNAREIGRGADPARVNALLTPMENLYNLRRGYLTGETQKEVVDAGVDLELSRLSAVISGDPQNAPVLALSKIVGENNPGLVVELNNVAQRALRMNSRPDGKSADVTDSEEAESMSGYFRNLEGAIRNANTGNLRDEGTPDEINNNLNHILDSVGVHGAAIESPEDLTLAVNFFSSDDYGQYVEQNGTALNRERARQARITVQEQYENVVKPLVAEEWRNASQLTMAVPDPTRPETAGQTEAISGRIRPFFAGGSFEFTAIDGANDRQTQAKIRDLNKRVAPIVERLVKAGAHLEGHRDYQRIYEANYSSLFGEPGTGAAAEE
tara:strand:+ start:813 stop:2585 length:1773 start_codon:yes stop_codon:yes gene_type:complete